MLLTRAVCARAPLPQSGTSASGRSATRLSGASCKPASCRLGRRGTTLSSTTRGKGEWGAGDLDQPPRALPFGQRHRQPRWCVLASFACSVLPPVHDRASHACPSTRREQVTAAMVGALAATTGFLSAEKMKACAPRHSTPKRTPRPADELRLLRGGVCLICAVPFPLAPG